MLITLIYMFVTFIQSRKISSVKVQLLNMFIGEENSVLFLNQAQHKLVKAKEESVGIESPYDKFICPAACYNHKRANVKELLWHHIDRQLFTVYPRQRVYLPQFKIFPRGEVTHPLLSNNSFEINESERKQYFLIECERKIYNLSASNLIQLEDYGLIVAFEEDRYYVYFILETDIDHVTNFLITLMQGQYYTNNGLNLIRVLSILPVEWPRRECSKTCLKNHVAQEISFSPQFTWLDEKYVEEVIASSSPKEGSFLLPLEDFSASVLKEDDYNSLHSKEDNRDILQWYNSDEAGDYVDYPDYPSDEEQHLRVISVSDIVKAQPKPAEIQEEISRDPIKYRTQHILIYADSDEGIRNVKNLLEHTIIPTRYKVLALSTKEDFKCIWKEEATLVIAIGNFDAQLISQLVEYVVQGGKLLALCSNILHTLLPMFKTAEVCESKLVKFSYDKYKKIDLVHDIFCYQASPVRARFSQENEEARASELKLPATIKVRDKLEKSYTFNVTELGREETWHNPSLLLATLPANNGKIVFSQIRLEVDPTIYASEENRFAMLEKSDDARFDIVRHLFKRHFYLEIIQEPIIYTPAYFLGDIKKKVKMIENLKDKIVMDNVLKMPKYKVQFCKGRTAEIPASFTFLPIMIHMCPTGFNTVLYFDNLQTDSIGRLVIFSDVLTSSIYVTGTKLEHGLAVIARQQTRGLGLKGDPWLSEEGCAMFTIQVHILKDSFLGGRVAILEHIVSVAILLAVKSRPGYEKIDLYLKWPNDIYASDKKVGGTIISTQLEDSLYICNIGVGINLDNDKPTTCINKQIARYNDEVCERSIQPLKYEEFFAFVFNQLENLINKIQNDNSLTYFRNLYYEYWLQVNEKISVATEYSFRDEKLKDRIVGIDDFEFLLVQSKSKRGDQIPIVHSDGNSFDPLKGLILSKQKN